MPLDYQIGGVLPTFINETGIRQHIVHGVFFNQTFVAPVPVTDNTKLSLLSWNQPYNHPVPAPVGSLTDSDKQHFIWQPASPVWGAVAGAQVYPSMLIAAAM